MVKPAKPITEPTLSAPERVFALLCGERHRPEAAGVTGETVTSAMVMGLIDRDAGGGCGSRIAAALRRLLGEL
ncbi:MAG: hypothetical protein ACLPKB_13900 [Xanthobacteraceae bacterium]